MANQGLQHAVTQGFIAEVDIAAGEAVATTATNTVTNVTTANFPIDGIALSGGLAGESIPVVTSGDWVKAIAGAAVTANNILMVNGAGRLINGVPGNSTFTVAKSRTAAAADGDAVYVKLFAAPVNYKLT